MKVLFCGEYFPEAPRALQRALPDHEVVTCPASRVVDSLAGVDVLVPAMVRVDASILDAGKIRLVQQFATGVEGIDLAAARARDIPVANIPAEHTHNAQAAAELAVLHLLAQFRRFRAAGETVAARQLGVPVGTTLAGKRVVVLGLGAVGRAVARLLRPFGATVAGVSRRPADQVALDDVGVEEYHDLDHRLDALAGANAVVVCLRQSPATVGLVGAAEIAALAPGSVVVNVARGGLVDYAALRDGLVTGHLLGAGLDVFWQEPFDPDDPLLALNVSATAHVGGVTAESYTSMAAVAAENVRRLDAGQPLLHRVA